MTLVGASKLRTLNNSMEAVNIHLDKSDLKKIEAAVPTEKIAGESMPKAIFRNGILI